MPVLLTSVAVLLAGVIAAPFFLSGQDIMAWARTGLDLHGKWPWVVFYALDATALISVLICVYCAWNGQRAGLFSITVWGVAVLSAAAQYKHGQRISDTAPDAVWFFPLMALIAPFLLELVLAKFRAVQRQRAGQAAKQLPKFGLWRWIPGVGSFKETYGAWRTARLLNLSSYDQAVQEYRRLCPTGTVRVLKAIREQHKPARDGSAEQEDETTDLYETPVQEQPHKPVQKKEQATRVQDNEKYLEIIRRTWPDEIPAGNQIRTKLGVNYNKSKKLIEQLEEERNS